MVIQSIKPVKERTLAINWAIEMFGVIKLLIQRIPIENHSIYIIYLWSTEAKRNIVIWTEIKSKKGLLLLFDFKKRVSRRRLIIGGKTLKLTTAKNQSVELEIDPFLEKKKKMNYIILLLAEKPAFAPPPPPRGLHRGF